jgi:hypothetical protein
MCFFLHTMWALVFRHIDVVFIQFYTEGKFINIIRAVLRKCLNTFTSRFSSI